MAHNTSPAILISYRKPDCQPSRTIAIHSRHTQPASQPMTHRHDMTHSQPATQPIRLHYNNATRYTLQRDTGISTAHSTRTHTGKESLFIWEAGRHHPPAPRHPTSATPNAENPSS